jgi:hypothetical protein
MPQSESLDARGCENHLRHVNGPIRTSRNSGPKYLATAHSVPYALSVRAVILLLQVRIERCLNRGILALLHTRRDTQFLERFILPDKLWHQVRIIRESSRPVEERSISRYRSWRYSHIGWAEQSVQSGSVVAHSSEGGNELQWPRKCTHRTTSDLGTSLPAGLR